MAAKYSSYLSTDETGHSQASFLSGDNSETNIAPQAKDLNHGSYLSVENGEKAALIKGNTIESQKISYSSVQPGNRPDAFMMNAEQENLNEELSNSDMLNSPNPRDTLRAHMSTEEYADLMEKIDTGGLNIQDTYQVDVYTTLFGIMDANGKRGNNMFWNHFKDSKEGNETKESSIDNTEKTKNQILEVPEDYEDDFDKKVDNSDNKQNSSEQSNSKSFRDSLKVTASPEEIAKYNKEHGASDIPMDRPAGGVERERGDNSDARWDAYETTEQQDNTDTNTDDATKF